MTGDPLSTRSGRAQSPVQPTHLRDDRQLATAWAILLASVTGTLLLTPPIALLTTMVPFMALLAVASDA